MKFHTGSKTDCEWLRDFLRAQSHLEVRVMAIRRSGRSDWELVGSTGEREEWLATFCLGALTAKRFIELKQGEVTNEQQGETHKK